MLIQIVRQIDNVCAIIHHKPSIFLSEAVPIRFRELLILHLDNIFILKIEILGDFYFRRVEFEESNPLFLLRQSKFLNYFRLSPSY